MVSLASFANPSFKHVAKGLLALHRLIQRGEDESPEAEAIRDALDAPLHGLNAAERERAQWLSEDLYSLSEPANFENLQSMTIGAQLDLNEAYDARQSRDWDRALGLLRRWRTCLAPALLAYMRGTIWLEAGLPDVATAFFERAVGCDLANANYQALYLHALMLSDANAAQGQARTVLADAEIHAPLVVARAAEIRLSEIKTAANPATTQPYRELIPILERNLARIEIEYGPVNANSARSMTLALLGFCHEFVGGAAAAIECYSQGLALDPHNDAFLVARGILQYGKSPTALEDFSRAVESRSPLVWPYLFLAHHFLTTGSFEECRRMCETGLEMQGPDSAKSQLQHWRAIAQAELRFPPDVVRVAFEAALSFDPSNENARRNLDAYVATLRMPQNGTLPKWEQMQISDVKQFGFAELAERQYSFAA